MSISTVGRTAVLCIDPFDGGAFARALIQLEASARHQLRPRFRSKDSPGPAQTEPQRCLHETRLARCETVLWNLLPRLGGDQRPLKCRSERSCWAGWGHRRQLSGG